MPEGSLGDWAEAYFRDDSGITGEMPADYGSDVGLGLGAGNDSV